MGTDESRPRIGRPPTGYADLVPITAYFLPEEKARLTGLARAAGRPTYTFIEQAWQVYWASLSEDDRAEAERRRLDAAAEAEASARRSPTGRPVKKRKRLGYPPHRMAELRPVVSRLAPLSKERLDAVARLLDLPVYLVVAQAWSIYWKSLPARQRKAAERHQAAGQ